jgi:hypothetical protein
LNHFSALSVSPISYTTGRLFHWKKGINNFLGSDMVWSKAIPKKAAPTVFYSLPNLMVHRQISMMHRQILKFNKTVGTY